MIDTSGDDQRDPSDGKEPPRRTVLGGRLVLFLFGTSVTGFFGWVFYVAYFGVEATTERTERHLRAVTFSTFELRNTTLDESVQVFREALRDAGLDESKVQVRLIDEPSTIGKRSRERTNLKLPNIPAKEAGMYVAALFDLELFVHGKEVRIQPEGKRPLLRRTIRCNPSFNPELRGVTSKNSDGSYDMREFFSAWGVSFQEGSWARMRPGSGKVEVLLPQSGIDLIYTSVPHDEFPPTWKERVLEWFSLSP